MNSKSLIDLLKEQISIEATDRVVEQVKGRIDELLADRLEVNKKYLTVKGACEYLGVGRSTFYSLIGKYKPLKIMLGGSPRYAIGDLDKMFRLA